MAARRLYVVLAGTCTDGGTHTFVAEQVYQYDSQQALQQDLRDGFLCARASFYPALPASWHVHGPLRLDRVLKKLAHRTYRATEISNL